MEVTRNVIIDLLPLFLADEVSDDTRILVEEYLETDQELASMANQSAAMELPGDFPVTLSEKDKLKTYKRTRWVLLLTIASLSILIALILAAVFYSFFVSV